MSDDSQTITRRSWDEDEPYLRKTFADTPTEEIAAHLGRSLTSVYQHARKLELEKSAEFNANMRMARNAAATAALKAGALARRVMAEEAPKTEDGRFIALDGTVLPAWVTGVRRHICKDED